MLDKSRSVDERRQAALWLTRLKWLDALPSLPPDETLEYLELAGRFVETRRERRFLVERVITPCLCLPSDGLSERQQVAFLIYRAAMLDPMGQTEQAGQDYAQAGEILDRLSTPGTGQPEDGKLRARLLLGLGQIDVSRAENGLEEPAEEYRQRALSRFVSALDAAWRYGQDVVLSANIQTEICVKASLGDWGRFRRIRGCPGPFGASSLPGEGPRPGGLCGMPGARLGNGKPGPLGPCPILGAGAHPRPYLSAADCSQAGGVG
jgi:hypothetical protein